MKRPATIYRSRPIAVVEPDMRSLILSTVGGIVFVLLMFGIMIGCTLIFGGPAL